jgi:ribosome biogenesis protein BMS1
MGVLTHLDEFRSSKTLNKTKKKLKHRFWTEIVEGAKLFYLSGIQNGRYLGRDILNLARFLSVMKFRPLTWKSTHPFVLADRYEDITDMSLIDANPKCDRTITLYGWVRGTYLKPQHTVHVMGVGDFQMDDVSLLPDPCPSVPPQQQKRRSLNEKEK